MAIDPMKNMISSYLASRNGQEMIQNYLSSPEGQKAIVDYFATPQGKKTLQLILPRILEGLHLSPDITAAVTQKIRDHS